MTPSRARPRTLRRGPGDERGATLVELSIVGLLVMTLILAVFEFGLLFRDHMTVADAVADAARVGALLGPGVTTDGRNGDFEIVETLREDLSALDDTVIASIVVFKSTGTGDAPEDQIPTPCRNGIAVTGVCNVYDVRAAFGAVEDGDTSYFVCSGGGPSCSYDPSTRDDGPNRADIETIGVFLRVERGGYTGMFASTWTITKAAVSRLEPGVVE